MKKPRISQTLREIDTRVAEIKEGIDEENKKIIVLKEELQKKEDESEKAIRGHEILIEEYILLFKHYQEERVLIANPSSRNGRNKIESKD